MGDLQGPPLAVACLQDDAAYKPAARPAGMQHSTLTTVTPRTHTRHPEQRAGQAGGLCQPPRPRLLPAATQHGDRHARQGGVDDPRGVWLWGGGRGAHVGGPGDRLGRGGLSGWRRAAARLWAACVARVNIVLHLAACRGLAQPGFWAQRLRASAVQLEPSCAARVDRAAPSLARPPPAPANLSEWRVIPCVPSEVPGPWLVTGALAGRLLVFQPR